ncbi:MAG: hypothetical protein JXJ04_21735 [Spirochaetales bacterium]|nr:hypothetical protein [Spirochaetales bacterium]
MIERKNNMLSKTKYKKMESDNYTFFVLPNSPAERDIEDIIKIQEKCFSRVCEILKHETDMKINIYFFNDPVSCGKSYNVNADPEEEIIINTFCYYPNNIHATYNEQIKTIGHHEVAHLLLFEKLHREPNILLNEGFAVYCDNNWWRLNLHKWAKYIHTTSLIDIDKTFQSVDYFRQNSVFSYPLVGSYCKWKINKDGIDEFIEILKKSCSQSDFHREELIEYKEFIKTIFLSDDEINNFSEVVANYEGRAGRGQNGGFQL